ncbi:MAG: c-type cytochrome [Bacteroidia bacterium]
MKKLTYLAIFLMACSIGFIGCQKEYFPPVVLDENTPVSFKSEIVPIFTASCLGSGCHDNGGASPNLTEALAYTSLVDGGMIDTLQPEKSVLYDRIKIKGDMPKSGKLPETQIQKILLWIKQGAKDS